jgi:aspartokinase/homoserine dehydrogenase 1
MLLEAVQLASSGNNQGAMRMVDRVVDLASANYLLCSNDGPSKNKKAASSFMSACRTFLEPLRQLLTGISLLREKTPQALDAVLSFGERLSACILAELLRSAYDVPAYFQDAREWVVTDDTFGAARVDWLATKEALRREQSKWGTRVVVNTGFIGCTPDGRTTTLGRNGSDYTATLLGAALLAQEVVINTDVNGVMTADPRVVREAIPVPELSYIEALELAIYGTRMFHPRTMLPLIESSVPLCIRNTMGDSDSGRGKDVSNEPSYSPMLMAISSLTSLSSSVKSTRISATGDTKHSTSCVTSLEKLALVQMRLRRLHIDTPAGLGQRMLNAIEKAGNLTCLATQTGTFGYLFFIL